MFRKLLISVLLCVSGWAHAQNSNLQNIAASLTKLHQSYPQEKVFIHTDRDIYSGDQMIWFKAYIVNATTHQPIDLSKLLYVELLDERLELVDSRQLYVDEGFSVGNIALPKDIIAGNYILRAYTKYMLNVSTEFVFRKDLTIIDLETPESLIVNEIVSTGTIMADNEPLSLDVQFFPEGGHLVAGNLSVVGLKVLAPDGFGKYSKGAIYDSDNSKLIEFESNDIGIGKFTLVPQENKSYYAKLEGDSMKYDLPPIKAEGYLLQARLWNGFLTVQAVHNKGISMENYAVLVHARGNPQALFTGASAATAITSRIKATDLEPGIVTITLMDPEGRPLCERLVYIDAENMDLLSIETDKSSYETREIVSVAVTLEGADSAQVSLSVVRPEYLIGEGAESNISDYLYLKSDIKGFVEDPGRYFDGENPKRLEDLDNLLLTQGWRRFDWPEVKTAVRDIKYKPEFGINIEGQVVNYYNEDKGRESEILLLFMENFLAGESTSTDESGRFLFSNLQFVDSVTAIFQASEVSSKKKRNKENKKSDPLSVKLLDREYLQNSEMDSLFLRNPNSVGFTEYKESVDRINKVYQAYNFDEQTILLDEIAIQGYRDSWKDSPFNRGQLYRTPSRRFVVDSVQIGNVFNVIEMFRRIPGIQVYGIFPNYQIQVRNSTSFQLDTTPLFLVDNIPTDISFIVTMDASQIEFIDVLSTSQATMYGALAYGGVIAIYTRTENKSGLNAQQDKLNWGVNSFDLVGFQTPDAFFAPRYDIKKEEHIKPDYRSVLHWEPTIFVREGGKTEFDFYSSDERAEYYVIAQGVSYDGKPLYHRFKISVGRD